MSLAAENVRSLHTKLNSGELTSTAIVEACLAEITKHNKNYNALTNVQSEAALNSAQAIDQARKHGQPVGELSGLPVIIKDNICTKGVPTTCSSKMLANFVPPYSAHVVKQIEQAGGVIIGKANLDEFAMGSSTEHSYFGASKNPWNTAYVPGGSSGGTASGVAGHFAPFGLGSDTGGSIRQPSAFCGIVGLKPTYGRVSRYGLVAFASSLDQIGPMANDVYGAALLYDIISGHDPLDSSSLPIKSESTLDKLDQPLAGIKIGVVQEHFSLGIAKDVETATKKVIEVYKQLGAEIVDVELPHGKYAVATYYLIGPCEASSNLSRYDGVHYGYRASEYSDLLDMYCKTRAQGFGAEVKRRIMLGTYALSAGYYDAYYLKALKVRRLIREDYNKIFDKVDFVLSPVTPTSAFKFGEHMNDPLTMYLADIYTISANLSGLPALAVPCGFTKDKMPLGFQLMGHALEEEKLLRAARMYEAAVDWRTLVFS